MDRTLTFSLLDDGSVLVEFKNVTSTSTMSMRAKDIRSCPYVDIFIGAGAKKSNLADVCEKMAKTWRTREEQRRERNQRVIDALFPERTGE